MINIGVIGYGYWGANLLRNFAESLATRPHVVVDPDPARLEIAQRRYQGVKTATDIHDILDDPTLDAVAIATPVSTHFDLAMTALRAGKHVWLEKPMTETSAQARQLIEEAEKRNLTLLVDHTFIYTGAIRKMREIVAGGDLGDIFYYDSTRINLGLFQRDVNVICDLAVHDFSILDFLLEEHPIAVTASGTTHFSGVPENLAYVTLFYNSGKIAHVNVNWLAPVKVRQILLGGSKKMIVYDDMAASEKIKVYDSGVKLHRPVRKRSISCSSAIAPATCGRRRSTRRKRCASPASISSTASRTGATPITDGRLGLRVVEVIEAATTSMHGRGETVQIECRGMKSWSPLSI